MLRLMSDTPVVTNVTLCVCVCVCVCVCGIIRSEGGRASSQLSVDGHQKYYALIMYDLLHTMHSATLNYGSYKINISKELPGPPPLF